jgi:exonuclease III
VFLEEVSHSRKRNRDILLGTWNVRSLYRTGSLMAAVRELARYKLDLVGVQEVRWNKEGIIKAGEYCSFYGKGIENHQLGTGFFVHHTIVSAVKLVVHHVAVDK